VPAFRGQAVHERRQAKDHPVGHPYPALQVQRLELVDQAVQPGHVGRPGNALRPCQGTLGFSGSYLLKGAFKGGNHQEVNGAGAAARIPVTAARRACMVIHMARAEEDAVVVKAGGHEVSISSPAKVFFAEHGATKLDLVRYYQSVEGPLMRALGGRPVLLQRFPNGAGGPSFFQKRVPETRPDWIQTSTVSTPNGTTSNALVAADLGHILWAVNMGCLGFHVWPSRAADPEHADELRIDLDPSPGVTFAMVQEAATVVRGLMDEVGVMGLPKTTGNRGIHVYVRLLPHWTSFEVRAAAVAVARELERRRPDLVTAAWWKEERGTRVFIDFNQNAPHKTIFGAWCVRARPGAQVSTPFGWDELGSIRPDELTIETVPARVRSEGDPWQVMDSQPQSLEPLLEMHRRDAAAGLQDAPWPPVYPKMPGEPPRVAPSRAKKA
jgi:DNA ligase D